MHAPQRGGLCPGPGEAVGLSAGVRGLPVPVESVKPPGWSNINGVSLFDYPGNVVQHLLTFCFCVVYCRDTPEEDFEVLFPADIPTRIRQAST
jgi:hypothetical protein